LGRAKQGGCCSGSSDSGQKEEWDGGEGAAQQALSVLKLQQNGLAEPCGSRNLQPKDTYSGQKKNLDGGEGAALACQTNHRE
jgi:hypothetical protein